MQTENRLDYLDNLRTFLILLVVVVHAGVVYESSGFMGPYWIVDDPAVSDLPGLVNLMLDLFVMPTIFFIAGYFACSTLDRKGARRFLKARFRRLVLPWVAAVLILMPLYHAIYLYSRGLPQGDWTVYFHFTNDRIGMSWLWFLPVLFLFNVLYVLLRRLNLPTRRLPLGWAVAAVFALSVGSCLVLGELGWTGWTKTPLADFQNERLLPYFLIFLLGSLCFRKGVLAGRRRNMKLYIAINATAWIPMNAYLIVLLNFFLRPGKPIFSNGIDALLLWTSSSLSMLGLMYCAVATFKYFYRGRRRIGRALGRLSYAVYINHVIVMGPIAVVLLRIDLPALVKYPVLALSTYLASNLVAHAYTVTVKRWIGRASIPRSALAPAGGPRSARR